MTFTLEGEGCAPQAAGKPQSMDANRHPDANVDFLECLIVSTDDTATTAATAGDEDFGTSPFFGGSQPSHNLRIL